MTIDYKQLADELQQLPLDIDVEKLFHIVTALRKLKILERFILVCEHCEGSGFDTDESGELCPVCRGCGIVDRCTKK